MTDDVATRRLVLHHLAAQRPMMDAFLDALGVAHDNGLIQEGRTSGLNEVPRLEVLSVS